MKNKVKKINDIIKNSVFKLDNHNNSVIHVYMDAIKMVDEKGDSYISIGNDLQEILKISKKDDIIIDDNKIKIPSKKITITIIKKKIDHAINFEYGLLENLYLTLDDILDIIVSMDKEDELYEYYNNLYDFIFNIQDNLNLLFCKSNFNYISIKVSEIDLKIKKQNNEYLYSTGAEEWFENITELYSIIS